MKILSKDLMLVKHKREFLTSISFNQTYESDNPKEYNGFKHSMERWDKIDSLTDYILFIHFSEDPKIQNYCELYSNGNDQDCEIFSERNMVSQLKKRLEL